MAGPSVFAVVIAAAVMSAAKVTITAAVVTISSLEPTNQNKSGQTSVERTFLVLRIQVSETLQSKLLLQAAAAGAS